jgi:hypothetical protein
MDFLIVPRAEASIETLMKSIDRVILNPVIFFLFAVAMVYFIYGLVQYLVSPNNEEVRKKSKGQMLWGVIGLFVMVAVFGIMRVIINTLGITNVKVQGNGDYTVTMDEKDSGYTMSTSNANEYQLDNTAINDPTKTNTTKPVELSAPTTYEEPEKGKTYTDMPFTGKKFISNDFCWEEALYAKDTNEHNATEAIKALARDHYLSYAKSVGASVPKSLVPLVVTDPASVTSADALPYPVAAVSQTFFDQAHGLYYIWWGAIGTLGNGDTSDCRIPETLEPSHQSLKTSSISGKYFSDGSFYRAVDSGVDAVMITARNIAIKNALIQIAETKGLDSTDGIVYRIIQERYFPPDDPDADPRFHPDEVNYDYWVAIESPK